MSMEAFDELFVSMQWYQYTTTPTTKKKWEEKRHNTIYQAPLFLELHASRSNTAHSAQPHHPTVKYMSVRASLRKHGRQHRTYLYSYSLFWMQYQLMCAILLCEQLLQILFFARETLPLSETVVRTVTSCTALKVKKKNIGSKCRRLSQCCTLGCITQYSTVHCFAFCFDACASGDRHCQRSKQCMLTLQACISTHPLNK